MKTWAYEYHLVFDLSVTSPTWLSQYIALKEMYSSKNRYLELLLDTGMTAQTKPCQWSCYLGPGEWGANLLLWGPIFLFPYLALTLHSPLDGTAKTWIFFCLEALDHAIVWWPAPFLSYRLIVMRRKKHFNFERIEPGWVNTTSWRRSYLLHQGLCVLSDYCFFLSAALYHHFLPR